MVKKIIFAMLIISSLALISCASDGYGSDSNVFNSVPDELQCTQDSDCVAATCCHATDAVNVDNAPDCTGILCSADCQEGTMDCGQARANCVEGACAVVQS
ncbi:hypothetical protein CL619_03050 [archaeon]|nr:hypothetical protein [archaeon]|tara:strand:+ start:1600 stop:1902 length:303 start_codon:yes stop_codon:yes gene_type:complete